MSRSRHLPMASASQGEPARSPRPRVGDGVSDSADLGSTSVNRRDFVRVLSTAMAAVGAHACTDGPPEKIIPYVERPPEVVPGVPRFYATSTSRGGYGFGLVAESREGRPVKLEGHPRHPASLGGIFSPEQAELLSLYDPDRPRSVRRGPQPSSLERFFAALRNPASGLLPERGRGLHLLLEPTSSPLLRHMLDRVQRRLPEAVVHVESFAGASERLAGAARAFGSPLETHFSFDEADVVLDLASNFLADMPMSALWARQFASRRDISAPDGSMNRLYSVETTPSVTGATADHRLALMPSRIERFVAVVLQHVSAAGGAIEPVSETVATLASRAGTGLDAREARFARELAEDLLDHRSRSAVIVGERLPASVHVLGHALNLVLGNLGRTVSFTPSPLVSAQTSELAGLGELASALDAGSVQSLFVLGGNPAYKLPEDFDFQRLVARAKQRVVLDAYENETAEAATWFLPEQHFLESWGDHRAADGTVSFQQPLIRPLFGGLSVVELLAALAHEGAGPSPKARTLLERSWSERLASEGRFAQALGDGLLTAARAAKVAPAVDWSAVEDVLATLAQGASREAGLELEFLPDPRLGDGRLSNNPWLQETPDPITKLVWDNAALVSPQLARERGLTKGDVVELTVQSRSLEVPVLPVAGQAERTVSLWLGYGRRGSEGIAAGVGVDTAPLRRVAEPWRRRGARIRSTGRVYRLVTTQDTFDMHERPIALHVSRAEWKKQPHHFQHHDETPPTLYDEHLRTGPQWGMSVDLNRCTGCSACVTACMAENNVPTVGKAQVALGREMTWLRIDTYRSGHGGKTLMQPMMCQHCENAPCEYVCPVGATVHSPDGLNEMVYNRCVGTRFCSNNCPYKVRRFNWFEFNGDHREPKPMAFNPDVTVRARGVMEKCTFCVQRIRRAEIDAKVEGRKLQEGDVTTACEQACPTQAIRFGSLTDEDSEVSKAARSQRAYACLNELGTRPRVRYLGRVTNPREEGEK